jgi:hypothetical protein
MGHVFVLNVCYDVPVKLLSLEVLLIAVFVASLDGPRLIAFFFQNRVVPPSDETALVFGRGNLRPLRYALVVVPMVMTFWSAIPHGASNETPKDDVAGVYRSAPGEGDAKLAELAPTSWSARVLFTSGEGVRFGVRVDEGQHRIVLEGAPSDPPSDLIWTTSGALTTFTGTFRGEPVTWTTKKVDMSQSPLLTRGFHIITEYPFNR